MANPFFLLDPVESTADADWQEVVQNGVQPELSGILKRVSSGGGKENITTIVHMTTPTISSFPGLQQPELAKALLGRALLSLQL